MITFIKICFLLFIAIMVIALGFIAVLSIALDNVEISEMEEAGYAPMDKRDLI